MPQIAGMFGDTIFLSAKLKVAVGDDNRDRLVEGLVHIYIRIYILDWYVCAYRYRYRSI